MWPFTKGKPNKRRPRFTYEVDFLPESKKPYVPMIRDREILTSDIIIFRSIPPHFKRVDDAHEWALREIQESERKVAEAVAFRESGAGNPRD